MCLQPIKINNPSKIVALDSAQQLILSVPCGKCAECVSLQRNQWYARSYWEAVDTLNQGGYMYFDTLTYSDEYVPHISDFVDNYYKYKLSDFTVFNHSHWKLFLKNLRVKVNRLGYGNCLRYFLTSEYGTNTFCTHRPHYHIIFFVSNPCLHPYHLSRLVSDTWLYGRTDGLPYQTTLYVKKHIYGYDLGQNFNLESALRLVCNYVSKYICKDSSFTSILEKRKYVLSQYIEDDVLRPILRNVDMFHRQSQGFGFSYISLLSKSDYKRLYETSKMYINDPRVFIKELPLPYYYIRKLFYELRDNGFGGKTWCLTEYGKKWKSHRLLKSISTMAESYYNVYLNMPTDAQIIVTKLLDNRSFIDFSIYKTLYCGRILPSFEVDYWRDFVVHTSNVYESDNYLYHYNEGSKFVLDNFVTDKCLNHFLDDDIYKYGRLTKEITQPHPHYSSFSTECGWLGNCVPFSSFVSQNCISQNTFKEFIHFDDIDDIFNKYKAKQATIKQFKFDFLEELKRRRKEVVINE